MNTKQVLGTVTLVAIVGVTIYAIKKSKDITKSEGEAISLDEARYIVNEVKELDSSREEDMYDESQDFEEMKEEMKEVADWNRGYMGNEPAVEDEDVKTYGRIVKGIGYDTFSNRVDEDDDDDTEEEDAEDFLQELEFDEFNRQKPVIEEGNELRYEPNSVEALRQFRQMELMEWQPNEDTYQTLEMLFDFPFEPQNDGDEMLRNQIIDYRAHFFGITSKWVKLVSYADVILHYAKKVQFNCDETVGYWTNYFLEFNNLFHGYSSQAIDEEIRELNAHTYFNEERATFGLFGLTRESMDQAIRIADGNIDRSVTYEIEFNEFLKSCI